MIDVVQEYNNDFYLPAEQFFNILKKPPPGLVYDDRRETLNIDIVRYNINSVKIEKVKRATIQSHKNHFQIVI